jgi:FtsP/CotA-like multicopper oxidase with cupredoxin domain
MCTDDQVYRGLAGLLLIGDSRLALPTRLQRIRTHVLALKDIEVAKQGSGYAIPGNHDWNNKTHRTINGLVDPTMTIEPGETQLWRLANTSSAVWYRVALVDEHRGDARDPLQIVAQDGNPLVRPVRRTNVLLPPGHRVDVLVRAPLSGQRILKTLPFDQGRVVFPEDVLATLEVKGPRAAILAADRPVGLLPADRPRFPLRRGPSRRFVFEIKLDLHNRPPVKFTINGKVFDPDRVDAAPRLNTVERWTLVNNSDEWHPFHIHQNDFRVISINGRRPPPAILRGERDTVSLPAKDKKTGKPGVVVIDNAFTDFTGRFVFHCHILDHEDGGMMALVDVRK